VSAALEIATADPATIPIADLKRDLELSCRAAGVNNKTAREYAEAMRIGTVFPPVVVFTDSKGVHWLADGFHRTEAAELAGLTEIAAERRLGSRKDALIFAASANISHGLRRTTADKRRAIELVLVACPKWSDRRIGEACGVDNKTVAAARARLAKPEPEQGEEIPQSEPTAPVPTTDGDAVLFAKLLRRAEQLIAQCPEARRVEFWERITTLIESRPEAGGGEVGISINDGS
jgi:hypothetical protein